MDRIVKLRYGNTNTYLVGNLLIDTDTAGKMPALRREQKKQGLPMSEIKYVMATHYHPDHMGLIGELIKSGVKLLLLAHQKDFVHSSDVLYARQGHSLFVPIDERSATVIPVEESRAFLAGLGITGEIIRTKSHSPDGAALILDDGRALVGDLEPRAFLDGYEENEALKTDWDALLSRGVKTVYYGHANKQDL